VHTALLQMAPVLAAEKSHVPFYIAGGVLVAWAILISMAVGMRKGSFPENDGQQRVVMGISAVLVLAALVTAVLTSGSPEKATAASAETTTPAPAAAETTTSSTPEQTKSKPTATTGTPTPASSPAAGKTTKLTQAADPGGQLAFEKQELVAKAGTVTIEFMNASPVEHNLTIEEASKKVVGATPTFVGGKRSLTLKLSPGTYTFFCSVPGHRQAGMEGKLKVVA
jgi:plastocyanin